MKIVSARRSEAVRPTPAAANQWKTVSVAGLHAPSWAPSKLVGRGGGGPGGEAAAGPVGDLEPDDRNQADRGGPAAELLRVGEVRRVLAGDRAEPRPGRPADGAPGVDGAEDVAEQGREEREA